MHRILFSKLENAIWISHLDTMRMFQRAFRRADIPVKHTEGFNPHPFVSIAMPMSVGTQSMCELLDFTLLLTDSELSYLPERLNHVLPSGIRVLNAYCSDKKLNLLKYLHANVTLIYDHGVPIGGQDALEDLFHRPQLYVMRKTKRNIAETDILPMIRSLQIHTESSNHIVIDTVVCANEPSLNPNLLAEAVKENLPSMAPDAFRTIRLDILDEGGKSFR